ncbi:RsmB/NOP family class I SAM-dependent RNA methyltransferase [Novosphingobium sp. Fuku2-ISO-50]|uniref:RsmB/NOP family class I SAM-dependent RNA methyltransferase n=1 Tax=Novosphingobium sp. Fuku2-ISO-50 TaxID=1739114 RepID=UPI00076BDFC9|nr:methyltransferase domain-containing protein [Novosphingobium sp. Fuku2-ISO-50]KUR75475.1 SAM-dependent methyltransferase [Novosphingobium sp. Fuku2-ISO-50]
MARPPQNHLFTPEPTGPAEIPGSAARLAALRMIDAVLRRGDPLDQAAPPLLRPVPRADDRALAMAIAQEALRWLTDLDALIDSATRQILPEDAKARSVLRLMLVQVLRLGLPPHAVIATGLPLLMGGPRRLAHGVFSAILARGDAAALPAAPSLPVPVAERWGAAWPDRLGAIAAGLTVPPPLDLTLADPAQTAQWAERLGGISLMPGSVRLARGQAVETLAGFGEGAWWVQDLAAAIPARLLGRAPHEGARALDLCAAPGGKTMQLAAAGWDVTALDKSARRLERLSDNLARTGLAAHVVAADALEWQPEGGYDAILVDAPCSATGTCRRHPDVLHRRAAIDELTALQATLLARAAGWLNPGGTLVYAVCSLEPDEGEAQARTVTGLAPHPITAPELPEGIAPTAEGWLRSDPGMLAGAGGVDGFFAARWRA